jgi:hypothetical protein
MKFLNLATAVAVGLLPGFLLGECLAGSYWHHSLITAGFAEYDRKTGEWRLLTPAEVSMDPRLLPDLPPMTIAKAKK